MSKTYTKATHKLERQTYNHHKEFSKKTYYDDFLKNLTSEDVDRILCREFSESDLEEAREILANYGLDPSHKHVNRVRVAAVRLSDGNLEKLESSIDLAQQAYQDALAWAETPTYRKIPANMPREDVELVLEEDYTDYKEWVLWDA